MQLAGVQAGGTSQEVVTMIEHLALGSLQALLGTTTKQEEDEPPLSPMVTTGFKLLGSSAKKKRLRDDGQQSLRHGFSNKQEEDASKSEGPQRREERNERQHGQQGEDTKTTECCNSLLPSGKKVASAARLFLVAAASHKLKRGGVGLSVCNHASHTTQRDVYYSNPELFAHDQRRAVRATERLQALLFPTELKKALPVQKDHEGAANEEHDVPSAAYTTDVKLLPHARTRRELGIVAAPKSSVCGSLGFSVPNTTSRVDVAAAGDSGLPISHDFADAQQISVGDDVKAILIVEKEATYRQLIHEDVPRRHGVILLCGRGYPCVAARSFLAALFGQTQLPLLFLMDFDPDGICILLSYLDGVIAGVAHNSTAPVDLQRVIGECVRRCCWVGVRPALTQRACDLTLPAASMIPMSARDLKAASRAVAKLESLMNAVGGTTSGDVDVAARIGGWRDEAKQLLTNGMKCELQALEALGSGTTSDTLLSSYFVRPSDFST